MAGNSVIGALRAVLGIDTAQFETGLKTAQSKLGGFGKGAGVAFAAVAAGAAAMAGAVAAGTKAAIDAADDMGKAAQKYGVAVDQLSRLAYAGELADVSLDQLGTGLKILSKNMLSASKDGSPAAEAFEQLGISVKDADGNLKSSNAVFKEVAGKFEGMEDGAAKTALAMQIFGKSGADLIPLLNEGAAGIAAMEAESDALGKTIDGKTAAAAETFNDNMTRLGSLLGGITTRIAAAVAPTLATLTDRLINAATSTGFLDKLSQALSVTFRALAIGAVVLGTAFKTNLTIATTIAEAFGKVLRGDFAGAWKAVTNGARTGIADFRGAVGAIQDIWSEAGAKAGASAEAVGKQLAAPALAAAKTIKEAKKDFGLADPNSFKLDLDRTGAREGSANPIRLRVIPDIQPQDWSPAIKALNEQMQLDAQARAQLAEDLRWSFANGVMAAMNGDLKDFMRGSLQQIAHQGFGKAFEGLSGKLSSMFSKIKIPGLGGLGGGLVGGIIGIGASLLGGLFGSSKKKREREEKARQEAEAAAAKAADIANQKRALEIELMEAGGDAAGALAARRADELAAATALDPALAALKQKLFEVEDATLAQAEAEAKLAAAREASDAALATARDQALAALQAGADKAGELRDLYRGFASDLSAYARDLTLKSGAGAGSYRALGAAFDDIARRSMLGDSDALARFRDAAEALQAAGEREGSAYERARDQLKIRLAAEKSAATATRQADLAQSQLDGINATVHALGLVNSSVLSIPAALQQLAEAMLGSARAAAGGGGAARDFGANPGVNAVLAAQTGYAGDFGKGGFQSFITSADAATQAAARQILEAFGQSGRIQGFATGGMFEIGGPAGIDKALAQVKLSQGEVGVITRTDPLAGMAGITAELRALRDQDGELMEQLIVKVDQLASYFRLVSQNGKALRTQEIAA